MRDPEVWYSPSEDAVYRRAPMPDFGQPTYYIAGDDVTIRREDIPEDARPMFTAEKITMVIAALERQRLEARRDRDA